MSDFIIFLIDQIQALFLKMSQVHFTFFGFFVNWTDLLISFVFMCFIISVFWKGVRK